MKLRALASLTSLTLLALSRSAGAQDIAVQRHPTRWRVEYEKISRGTAPDLSLVGLHYDLLGPLRDYPPLYVGVGGFAAVDGAQDGFFLGGFSVGGLWQLAPLWNLDVGTFLGGGGEAGGSTTNGWAIRPFVGIERILGLLAVRAELAYLDTSELDGDLTLALGISLPSEVLLSRELARRDHRPERIPDEAVLARDVRLSARYLWLDPDSDSQTSSGAPLDRDLGLMGLAIETSLGGGLFFPVEAYGATGGHVDGFVIGAAGLGYEVPLGTGDTTLFASASAVLGGGGGVETGSGLGWKALLGARQRVTRTIGLDAGIGRTSFPSGNLDATSLTFGVTLTGRPIELSMRYPRGNLGRQGLSTETVRSQQTRATVLAKLERPPKNDRKRDGSLMPDHIPMVGVRVEEPVHPNVSLMAAGFVANGGRAGGYSEGILGARLHYAPAELPGIRFAASLGIGPAGGAGIDVGSGLVTHYGADVGVALGAGLDLELGWGKAEAAVGSYRAEEITVGLSLALDRPVARR